MIRTSILAAAVTAAVLPTAAFADGAATFGGKCQVCHSVAVKAPALLAPNLRGVVGRKAASTGFANYSPALKSSGLTWTKENLDKFLTAPGKLVPGTRMVVMVPDGKQRAELIAWLATQK